MIFRIMNINDLDEDMTAKYFSMLTPAKQNKLLSMQNRKERSLLFCCEIIARQCLSELCDAPEFTFDILCNPNSRSAVGNYSAEISVVNQGDYVACAASYEYIGIGLAEFRPFSFKDAQEYFTDSEIRTIFAESKYSFNQIVNATNFDEKSSVIKFAVLSSLKEAHFNASGRGLRSMKKKVSFIIEDSTIKCSDQNYNVVKSYVDIHNGIAVSVIERKK